MTDKAPCDALYCDRTAKYEWPGNIGTFKKPERLVVHLCGICRRRAAKGWSMSLRQDTRTFWPTKDDVHRTSRERQDLANERNKTERTLSEIMEVIGNTVVDDAINGTYLFDLSDHDELRALIQKARTLRDTFDDLTRRYLDAVEANEAAQEYVITETP